MKTNYRSIRLLPCLVMVAAQLAFTSAYAADNGESRGQLSSSDYKFAKEAAMGGMFEVNLGNMAGSNSRNPAVQQFGQHMVKDHGDAGQKLQQIATAKGATLPTELTSKQQHEIDRLSKLSGTEFDKAYVSLMVKAHKTDERLFKKGSADIQDADLKNFFATTLPTIQEHLRMAEDLENNVKNAVTVNN